MMLHDKVVNERVIDFQEAPTFCIHLTSRNDRINTILYELPEHGFRNVEMVQGTNGEELNMTHLELTLRARVSFESQLSSHDRNKHNHKHTKYEMGQYISHVLLWERIVTQKMTAAKIFQDNALFKYASVTQFTHVWQEMPLDADMILLSDIGISKRNIQPALDTVHFQKVCGNFSHLTAYYLTQRGAQKLCRMSKTFPIDMRVDEYVSYCIQSSQTRLVCYALTDPLCGRNDSINDDSHVNYNHNNGDSIDESYTYLGVNQISFLMIVLFLCAIGCGVYIHIDTRSTTKKKFATATQMKANKINSTTK
jgi:GR25 family glycosyltransferase involved in LPS biosynthesis